MCRSAAAAGNPHCGQKGGEGGAPFSPDAKPRHWAARSDGAGGLRWGREGRMNARRATGRATLAKPPAARGSLRGRSAPVPPLLESRGSGFLAKGRKSGGAGGSPPHARSASVTRVRSPLPARLCPCRRPRPSPGNARNAASGSSAPVLLCSPSGGRAPREGDALRLPGSASNKGAPCRAPGWTVGRGSGAGAGEVRRGSGERGARPERLPRPSRSRAGGAPPAAAARGTMAVGRAHAPDPPGRWTWKARRRRRRPGPSRPPWRPWSCGCPWWRGCWREGHRGGGRGAQAAIRAGQDGEEPRPPQGTLRGQATPGGAALRASLARLDPSIGRCRLRATPRARLPCTEPGAQKRRLIRLPHARGRSRAPESRPGEAPRGGGLRSLSARARAGGAAGRGRGGPRRPSLGSAGAALAWPLRKEAPCARALEHVQSVLLSLPRPGVALVKSGLVCAVPDHVGAPIG